MMPEIVVYDGCNYSLQFFKDEANKVCEDLKLNNIIIYIVKDVDYNGRCYGKNKNNIIIKLDIHQGTYIFDERGCNTFIEEKKFNNLELIFSLRHELRHAYQFQNDLLKYFDEETVIWNEKHIKRLNYSYRKNLLTEKEKENFDKMYDSLPWEKDANDYANGTN